MMHAFKHFTRLVSACGLALILLCGLIAMLGAAQKVQARIPTSSTGSTVIRATVATGTCTDTFPIIPGTLVTLTAHFNGVDRPVSFYLPTSYQPTQTLPLWFALNGGAQDASVWFEPSRHTIDYAENEGFLLVMPNGLPKPNRPATDTNYFWADSINQDYIAYLMDCMEQQYAVDPHRIYAIGFSGGGKLAYQLAARPDISPRLAAIATAAGEWGARSTIVLTMPWDIVDPSAAGGVPLPALLLQGGSDQRSRLEGGFEEGFETVRASFQVKVDAWRLFVGATTTLPISLTYAPPRVTTTLYANLATGNVVVEAIDPILAHKWPDWNYMGAIVDFFNQVPTRTARTNRPVPSHIPTARIPRYTTSSNLNAVTSFSLTPGSLQTVTLIYANTQRDVALYVPSSYSATQVPLLMALHGGGQDASAMFAPSKHITTWAEAENFIAVFPNGLPRSGAPPTSTNYFWTDNVNVPYLNYVMNVLMANAAIDRQRVYVIGFSAGANMTYRLASDRSISQRIAAIATVAGHVGSKQALPTTPWENTDPILNGAWPISALFLQGEKDETHPVLGGFTSDYSAILQAFQTKVDLWRLSIGQLSGAGSSINLPYAPGRVTATLYLNTGTGYAVVAAIDPALAHAWPDWDFMGTIWAFFEQAPIRAWPVSVYLPLVMR